MGKLCCLAVFGIDFQKITFQLPKNILLEVTSRKSHYTYSFATQRTTWKHCLGIIVLENLISVAQKSVAGINFTSEIISSFRAPNLGSAERGHPDLSRFPRFLPICSDSRSLFPGLCSDLFRLAPISSDFFRPVFRTSQNNQGNPILLTPFSPMAAKGVWQKSDQRVPEYGLRSDWENRCAFNLSHSGNQARGSQQYSGTALGRLRVRSAEPSIGKTDGPLS